MTTREQWMERSDKRIREMVRIARKSGWSVTSTTKSHIRFTSPTGRTVIASGAGRHLDQHVARTRARLLAEGLESVARV